MTCLALRPKAKTVRFWCVNCYRVQDVRSLSEGEDCRTIWHVLRRLVGADESAMPQVSKQFNDIRLAFGRVHEC